MNKVLKFDEYFLLKEAKTTDHSRYDSIFKSEYPFLKSFKLKGSNNVWSYIDNKEAIISISMIKSDNDTWDIEFEADKNGHETIYNKKRLDWLELMNSLKYIKQFLVI